MLVRNAIRRLERFTRVTFRKGCYYAWVGNLHVFFGDVNGQVAEPCYRIGRSRRSWELEDEDMDETIRYWENRNGTLGHGLQGVTTIPLPNRQLDVLHIFVEYPGRRVRPRVTFCVTDHAHMNPGITSRFEDESALEIARLATEGRIPEGVVLDWIQERGGEVGRFLGQLPTE